MCTHNISFILHVLFRLYHNDFFHVSHKENNFYCRFHVFVFIYISDTEDKSRNNQDDSSMMDIDLGIGDDSNNNCRIPQVDAKEQGNKAGKYKVEIITGDKDCIVGCFAEHFGETVENIFSKLEEFVTNVESYLRFGDSTHEQIAREFIEFAGLQECRGIIGSYVLEALAFIFRCRVFVFDETLEREAEVIVGESLENTIFLLNTKDHYDLVVLQEDTANTNPETPPQIRLVSLYFFLSIYKFQNYTLKIEGFR